MNVHDVATKVLDTELFSQHTIANMNSGITFIFLLSQEKRLRWKEVNNLHVISIWFYDFYIPIVILLTTETLLNENIK